MKKRFLRFNLILLLFNTYNLSAQQKESYLFLGDTINIKKHQLKDLKKSELELIKPIDSLENSFIVNKTGNLKLKDNLYHFLDPLKDGVTKILVIGNSFSDDGVEYYFHEMARSTGKPLVIGNLFRGGAPLDFHLKNALGNIKIYSYRKTSIDGIKSNTDRTSILEALKDENWDYICFQQASVTSGDWNSVYESLPKLYDYVVKNYPISSVKYLYHQTWAYSQNAVTANFEKYNNDQNLMYTKIVDVSKRISELIPLYKLIPSGTAIQNGRTSYLGDNFTREGYHLDLLFGRFTAASTWYETIFSNVNEMKYKPSYLQDEHIKIAKEAATTAVKKPYVVTELKDFKNQSNKYIDFDKIQINFGSDLIIPGWLSLLFQQNGSSRFSVFDNHNKLTNVNVKVVKNFESRKANGPKRISFVSGIPAQVSQYYFVANVNQAKDTYLKIENLHPDKKYDVTIISTIAENVNSSQFEIIGSKPYYQVINPSFNRDKEIIFKNVVSKSNGELDLNLSLPEGINDGVSIINALIIKQVSK